MIAHAYYALHSHKIFIKIRIGLSEFSCKIDARKLLSFAVVSRTFGKERFEKERVGGKVFTESSFTLQYIEKFLSRQTAKSIFAVLNFSLENLIGSSRE